MLVVHTSQQVSVSVVRMSSYSHLSAVSLSVCLSVSLSAVACPVFVRPRRAPPDQQSGAVRRSYAVTVVSSQCVDLFTCLAIELTGGSRVVLSAGELACPLPPCDTL